MLQAPVTVRDIVDLAVVEIVARGRWNWQLRVDLMAAVRKALAQQPRALVLDVGGLLGVEHALTATVLLAEQQAAVQHPPVPLVVVGGADQVARLHAGGVARRIPVYHDRAAAVHQLAEATPPLGGPGCCCSRACSPPPRPATSSMTPAGPGAWSSCCARPASSCRSWPRTRSSTRGPRSR